MFTGTLFSVCGGGRAGVVARSDDTAIMIPPIQKWSLFLHILNLNLSVRLALANGP